MSFRTVTQIKAELKTPPYRKWTLMAWLCTAIMDPVGTRTLSIVSCQHPGRGGTRARANEMLTGRDEPWSRAGLLAACHVSCSHPEFSCQDGWRKHWRSRLTQIEMITSTSMTTTEWPCAEFRTEQKKMFSFCVWNRFLWTFVAEKMWEAAPIKTANIGGNNAQANVCVGHYHEAWTELALPLCCSWWISSSRPTRCQSSAVKAAI